MSSTTILSASKNLLFNFPREPSKPASWENDLNIILICLSQKSSVLKAVTLSEMTLWRTFALTLYANTFHFFKLKKTICDNTYTKRPKTTFDCELLEGLSFEWRKTKAKVITLANHKEPRQYSEPIKTRSNYM